MFNNNTLTITLSLNTAMFTAAMRGATAAIRAFGTATTQVLRGAGASVAQISRGLGGGVAQILRGAAPAIRAAGNALGSTSRGLGQLARGAGEGGGGLLRGISSFGGGGGNAFGGLVGAGLILHTIENTLSAVVGLIKTSVVESVKLAAEFERANVAFGVMVGSRSKGSNLLMELKTLAANTPYTGKQLTATGEQLLGMGVKPEAILPSIARLGDMAAGSYEKLQRLSLAYGQVIAAGRLYGTELRQFKDAGVGIEDFAKTMKVSSFEFRSLMEQGRVGANVVTETVNRLTSVGGRFANLSAEINQTVYGRWSNLVERLSLMGERLGLKFFSSFNVAQTLTGTANWLEKWEAPISRIIEKLSGVTGVLDDMWERLKVGGSVFSTFMQDMSKSPFFQKMTWDNTKSAMGGFVDFAVWGFSVMLDLIREVTLQFAQMMSKMTASNSMAWLTRKLSIAEINLKKAGGAKIDKGELDPLIRMHMKDENGMDSFDRVASAEATKWGEWANELRNEKANKYQLLAGELMKKIGLTTLGNFGGVPLGGIGAMMVDKWGDFARSIPPIPLTMKISPESEKSVMDFSNRLKEGLTPFDQWKRQTKEIEEALNGSVEAKKVIDSGVLSIAGLVGMSAPQFGAGIIDQKRADMMQFDTFEKLRSSIGDAVEAKLPTTAMYKSQQAQDIINRAMVDSVSIEQRVLTTLELANRLAEERNKLAEQTIDVLKRSGQGVKLNTKPGG